MFHAMNTSEIPGDAGVAIEYRVNGRAFRIDFMLSGENSEGKESLVIVELKQWTDIETSELADHVRTFVGGGIRDALHPSYQAWSYLSHLKMYNEYIYEKDVSVKACDYLHNCEDSSVVNASRYEEKLREVPVFIKGQGSELRSMINENIKVGTGVELLERIDSALIRPSQQLADAVGSMLKGHQDFVLIDEQTTVLEKIIKATAKTDPTAKTLFDAKGRLQGDPDLKDFENIPLPEGYFQMNEEQRSKIINQNADQYLQNEIIPHAKDAWIEHSKTRIGFEIPFTKYFYVYNPPRPASEIRAEVIALEKLVQESVEGLL